MKKIDESSVIRARNIRDGGVDAEEHHGVVITPKGQSYPSRVELVSRAAKLANQLKGTHDMTVDDAEEGTSTKVHPRRGLFWESSSDRGRALADFKAMSPYEHARAAQEAHKKSKNPPSWISGFSRGRMADKAKKNYSSIETHARDMHHDAYKEKTGGKTLNFTDTKLEESAIVLDNIYHHHFRHMDRNAFDAMTVEEHQRQALKARNIAKVQSSFPEREKWNGVAIGHEVAARLKSQVVVNEARMPLAGHPYHNKTEAELRYIMKDAGEARDIAKEDGRIADENKYADQVFNAYTVLRYRGLNESFITEGRRGVGQHHKGRKIGTWNSGKNPDGTHWWEYLRSDDHKKTNGGDGLSAEEALRQENDHKDKWWKGKLDYREMSGQKIIYTPDEWEAEQKAKGKLEETTRKIFETDTSPYAAFISKQNKYNAGGLNEDPVSALAVTTGLLSAGSMYLAHRLNKNTSLKAQKKLPLPDYSNYDGKSKPPETKVRFSINDGSGKPVSMNGTLHDHHSNGTSRVTNDKGATFDIPSHHIVLREENLNEGWNPFRKKESTVAKHWVHEYWGDDGEMKDHHKEFSGLAQPAHDYAIKKSKNGPDLYVTTNMLNGVFKSTLYSNGEKKSEENW